MGPVATLGLLGILLLVQSAAATQFTVGGSAGWAVPSGNTAAYNQWAERMRFQIGDSLVFNYPSGKDSVLRVTKEDYASCNTAAPLERHADGHTVVTFTQSGPYYFISGNKDSCHKSEKMVVVVLADRSKAASPTPAPSTAPPPSPPTATPAPSPAPGASASAQTPPSPPPEAPSTPAPTQQLTPSGAASVASWHVVIGSVGAFAASLTLLAAL